MHIAKYASIIDDCNEVNEQILLRNEQIATYEFAINELQQMNEFNDCRDNR